MRCFIFQIWKQKKTADLKGKETGKTLQEWVTRIHFMAGKNREKEASKCSSEIRKIEIHERKIIIHEKP